MRMKIDEIKHNFSLKDQQVEVKGWVRTLREQKQFSFCEVNDGSSLASLQVILQADLPHYQELLQDLTTGAAVHVKGVLKESPAKGQKLELHADFVRVIGKADPARYPLQKKRHTFEFLRTIAHLRPRTNTIGAVTRVRSALAFATHLFFQNKKFLYIQTPILTASDCEGAGQLFKVTTLNLENIKKEEGKVDYREDFFEKPAFLTVSGQLNAEIYASSMSDVYTFGPTFRAENSNTSRHLAEFWMIEPEMAFADLKDNMDNAEEYLKFALSYLLEHCPEDMHFFDKYLSNGLLDRLKQMIETPFERVSYSYAVRVLEKSNKSFQYPVKWGVDLQTEHERFLAEEYFEKPVILTDYPKEIKAFYMRQNDDEKTVAAMDILVPKVGEIVGGAQREERYEYLLSAIKSARLDPKQYEWYLDLRKYGTQPHAGYGVGFERLVQFATGMENIRDVIAFPRAPGLIDF